MVFSLLLWSLVGAVCWAVGRAALVLAARSGFAGPLPDFPTTVVVGLAAVSVLGGFWSLAAPLDARAALSGTAVLGLCLAVALKRLPRRDPAGGERRSWPERLLAALALILAAAAAALPVSWYDTGLYHLQAIRWIEQHPVVPGIANLHHRLALSAPWFEAQALFDPGLWGGRPALSLNGFLFAVAVVFFLGGIGSRARDLPLAHLVRWGCVPAAFWLLRRGLPSASPDVAVALLGWIVLVLLVEKAESGAAESLDLNAFTLSGLAAFAAAIKLSAAPLLLAPGWLVLRHWRHDRRRSLAIAGLAATVFLPYVLRSVIVSGYGWFPLRWTRIPVFDWTVPAGYVHELVQGVGDWARLPHRPPVAALDLAAWLPTWIHNLTPVDRIILSSLPCLGLVHLAWALRRRQAASLPRTPPWPPGYPLLLALTAAGTLFWLATAPDPRFGWSFYPILALLLAAPLLERPTERRRRAVALVLAAVLLDQGRRLIAQERTALEEHWLWPAALPEAEIRTERIGGISVHVPVSGERCWGAPPPCLPVEDSRIEVRGSDLRAGFRRLSP